MSNPIEVLLDEVLTNEFGEIKFKSAELEILKVDDFIKKIVDLHLRSTNQKPIIKLENSISAEDSQKLFRRMITIFMATSQYVDLKTKIEILDKTIIKIYKRESFEGLESVFLTTLEGVRNDLDDKIIEYYFNKFAIFDWPLNNGGGYKTSYFLDRNYSDLNAIQSDISTEFNKLKFNLNSHSSFKEKILAKRAQYYGISKSECVGWAMATGAAVAAVFRAPKSGGATAGEIIGNVFCPEDKTEKEKEKEKPKAEEKEKPTKEEAKGNENENEDFIEVDVVKEETKDGGCISPYANDFLIVDPYGLTIKSTKIKTAIPYGKGLNKYFSIKNNIYQFQNLPKIEFNYGKLNTEKLSFLNNSDNFKKSLLNISEFDKIEQKKDLDKIKTPKHNSEKVDKKDTYTNFGKEHIKPKKIEDPGNIDNDLTKEKLGKGKL